jgi:L-lysine exporter family protein LysE/ArgO
MIKIVLQGFLFGLAYVAPIGMQNLYVVNAAVSLRRFKAYEVALITIFFDITLALACFYGVGAVLTAMPALRAGVLAIGCISVIYIGIGLIRTVPKLKENSGMEQPLLKIFATCFAVTWLNPQAVLDGTLLLGGIRASLPYQYSDYFILGSALASFIWFMSLCSLILVFKNFFSEKILRVINIICGSIIILYGVKLAWSLILIFKK